jgi:hypothetical protein
VKTLLYAQDYKAFYFEDDPEAIVMSVPWTFRCHPRPFEVYGTRYDMKIVSEKSGGFFNLFVRHISGNLEVGQVAKATFSLNMKDNNKITVASCDDDEEVIAKRVGSSAELKYGVFSSKSDHLDITGPGLKDFLGLFKGRRLSTYGFYSGSERPSATFLCCVALCQIYFSPSSGSGGSS